jgi:hypothetical protein
MARANRHHVPGQVWHITYRCHKKIVPSFSEGASSVRNPLALTLLISLDQSAKYLSRNGLGLSISIPR